MAATSRAGSGSVVPEQTPAVLRYRLVAHDPGVLLQAACERRLVVVGEDVLAQRQHALHGGITLGYELDHAGRREAGQPGQELGQRHVAADREMVLEGEREQSV